MHRAVFRCFRVGKRGGNLTVMSNWAEIFGELWPQMRFWIGTLIKHPPEAARKARYVL